MYVPMVRAHGDALAGLACRLGPDRQVLTCPDWTVGALVAHVAAVTAWFDACCRLPVSGSPPELPTPPEWPEVLDWWQEQQRRLTERFETNPPSTPAWTPPGFPAELGSWARRSAHELAVHRLDLEHAAAGSAEPGSVPPLFDSAFAADGVDELLTSLLPPTDAEGTVQYWAEDAGTGWWLELTPGEVPAASRVAERHTGATATVRGSADDVYRAVWQRPHTGVTDGATELVAAVRTP